VVASTDAITTPLDGEAPRRAAVRSIGAAGVALLSVVGLGTAQGQRKNRSPHADKKKKRKRKKCNCPPIGLTFAESAPFTVAAGAQKTEQAVCPTGFLALSGGLEGESEVTVPCMVSESHVTPDGAAWVVNVYCLEASNTNLRVGAICLSESSFVSDDLRRARRP
jgi:hypothetical protein